MKVAVLTDERFSRVAGDVDVVLAADEDPERDADAITKLLDQAVDVAIVVGDDRTFARAATARLEHNRGRAERLDFGIIAAGDTVTVATAIDAPTMSRKALQKFRTALDRDRTRRISVPTLRVVDATRSAATLAFGFGMGLPVDYFRELERTSMSGRVGTTVSLTRMARERRGSESLVEADVFIDWEPRAEHFGYLLATLLHETWFDVGMGKGATARLGRSVLDVVGARSRVGRLVQRAAGSGPETFQRIHIDTNSSYVVDGAVVDIVKPRTVAITEGPTVRCLVP